MNKSIGTILKYFFFVALGILFVWLSVRQLNEGHWIEIKRSIQNSKKWLLIPVLALLLLSHYIRALRWKLLMQPMGYNPSNFNTLSAVMIGYLVNAGVPRLGEVVKCTILSKYEKIRADKLIGTMVMERAVDVVFLGIVFVAALVFQGKIIGRYVTDLFNNFFQSSVSASSITVGITIIVFILFIFLVLFILKKFRHIDAVGKVKNVFTGVFQGLFSIRNIDKKGLFIFYSFLIWGLYLTTTTIGIYALQETAHLGWSGGITALAVGSVGMILTPGGIGAYPLLVAKLVGLYGLDEHTIGTALGWLLWSVQTLLVIGGGLIFLLLFSYRKTKTFESGIGLTEQDIKHF